MAITVTSNRTLVQRVVPDQTTIVKTIKVGTPIRRVNSAGAGIETLGDVDTTSKINGSILIYNSSTGKWTASNDLENQNINGGSY